MKRPAGLLGLLAALFVVWVWAPAFAQTTPGAPAPKFPALSGRVVDDAHVLSPEVQSQLTEELAALEQKTSRQLVVVTLPSLQGYEISDYGYQLLRHWGIGQKGLDNGAILIVAPTEHKVRIEVGYGLEPILTDGMSSVILQEQVIPKFRAGDVSGGVVAGTQAIIQQMSLDTSTAEAKAAAATVQSSHQARHINPLRGIIPLILLVFFISSVFRNRRGGGSGLGWILPLMFLGGGGRGWGGDDEGGGGFGGGGGFSGGGGSGGGGGASGGW